jgi:hypothetical protein
MYKWHPSATQRREFAQRMQDPNEKAAYEARKEAKSRKRREKSHFDYSTAGGEYVPTQAQSDFCMNHMELFSSAVEKCAANMVLYGYSCKEKIAHDFIHVVNEKIRAYE